MSPFLSFTDHRDPALGAAVRDGRRQEFASFGRDPDDIPDPQDVASFARSKLDWSEVARAPHDELLIWHRRLIALRSAELTRGSLVARHVKADEDSRCMVVQAERLTWAVNFSSETRHVSASVAGGEPILSNDTASIATAGQICLPPESVAAFHSS